MTSVYELPEDMNLPDQSIDPPDSRPFFSRVQEYKFAISREMNALKDYLDQIKSVDFEAYKNAANQYNELTDLFDSTLYDAARNNGMPDSSTDVVLGNLETIFQKVQKIVSDVSPAGSIMHDQSVSMNPSPTAMVVHSDVLNVEPSGLRGYIAGMNPIMKKVLIATAIAGSVFAGKKAYDYVVKKKFVEKEGTDYSDDQDDQDDGDSE